MPDAPEIRITADGLELPGTLRLPVDTRGLVLFAHGSGSSRHSPRNVAVADHLNAAGLGTLLFDLLTPSEADDRARVFDIELLAARLAAATSWVRERTDLAAMPVGYFGASTGAAAALRAAAMRDDIGAVVSRGGRPDLAMEHLGDVAAPTLLIVGSRDPQVLELNERARRRLTTTSDLAVVRGATHLFEEPGALDEVADLARAWLLRHLAGPVTAP